MLYVGQGKAANGATFELEFSGDHNGLAQDHIRMVASHVTSRVWREKPEGPVAVRFRRWYADNWISAGEVDPD